MPLTFAENITFADLDRRWADSDALWEQPTADYMTLVSGGLADMCRALGADKRARVTAVSIDRMPLDAGGYGQACGRYFGRGAPLFCLTIEGDICANYGPDARGEYQLTGYTADTRYLDVRAPSRAALRDALKRIFPNARVGR